MHIGRVKTVDGRHIRNKPRHLPVQPRALVCECRGFFGSIDNIMHAMTMLKTGARPGGGKYIRVSEAGFPADGKGCCPQRPGRPAPPDNSPRSHKLIVMVPGPRHGMKTVIPVMKSITVKPYRPECMFEN